MDRDLQWPALEATAAGVGIRVYTVGVGGGAGGSLARIALAGRGRHFAVSDPDGLDRAYREIDALEPSSFPGTPRSTRVPRHAGLLWLAALLLAAECGVRASRYGPIP